MRSSVLCVYVCVCVRARVHACEYGLHACSLVFIVPPLKSEAKPEPGDVSGMRLQASVYLRKHVHKH